MFGAAGSAQKRLWSNAALSPNGKFLVQNGTTSVPGPPGAQDGLWDTKTGARITASNLDGVRMGMPSFSPDGTKIAHVQTNTGSLAVWSFDMATAKAGAETVLLPKGAGLPISWPSVTPDAKWLEVVRLDHNLGKIHDAAMASFELRYFEADGKTPVRTERLDIPGAQFRKEGLGKDVTDKFLAGLPGVQKEGCDGIITSARFILHRMPDHTRTDCLEFTHGLRQLIAQQSGVFRLAPRLGGGDALKIILHNKGSTAGHVLDTRLIAPRIAVCVW